MCTCTSPIFEVSWCKSSRNAFWEQRPQTFLWDIHTYIHTYMHTCIHTYMPYVHICICIYIYAHVCAHVHMSVRQVSFYHPVSWNNWGDAVPVGIRIFQAFNDKTVTLSLGLRGIACLSYASGSFCMVSISYSSPSLSPCYASIDGCSYIQVRDMCSFTPMSMFTTCFFLLVLSSKKVLLALCDIRIYTSMFYVTYICL